MKLFFVHCTVADLQTRAHVIFVSFHLWYCSWPSLLPLLPLLFTVMILYSSSNPVGLGLWPFGTGYVSGILGMASSPKYLLIDGTVKTRRGPVHPTMML